MTQKQEFIESRIQHASVVEQLNCKVEQVADRQHAEERSRAGHIRLADERYAELKAACVQLTAAANNAAALRADGLECFLYACSFKLKCVAFFL